MLDVLCENLLQTQKGTMSVTFELPDIFENQPLQGHALANALSGYPIWVKLFGVIKQGSSSPKANLAFSKYARSRLDVRGTNDALGLHTDFSRVTELMDANGENIQGNLVQGQDYLLGITNTNLRTTPLTNSHLLIAAIGGMTVTSWTSSP